MVTAKDLMVQPNPPRFLREGDVLEFTVKVANQSATRLAGSVRLTLAAARTGKSADGYFGNLVTDRAFDIPAKESRSFSWRLQVPDAGGEVLAYKAVGSTGRVSDGEEGLLPILPRRILVTESLPLPIRGPQTKKFDFTRLSQSGQSKTLKNETLTVQMVSNPSWYAVMALPYLMDFPYECTEQTFNRLYANALARHIAASDPKIRRIFDQWKGTPALAEPAGEEPGPEVGDAGRDPLGPAGAGRESGPPQRGHPLRRQPAKRGDGPAFEEAYRAADGRRGLALVPRRPAQRLHHPLHHHRLRPAAPPGRGDRHGPRGQVAGAAGRLDRSGLSRDPPGRQA